jgi:two-component system nitrogen regulation response regulator NtrX
MQIVVISGHGNIQSAVRAIKMGAFDSSRSRPLEKTVLVVRNAIASGRSSRVATCGRGSIAG